MSTRGQHKSRSLLLVGALHAYTHVYHVALMPLYLLIQRDFKFEGVGQATALVTIMMVAYFLPSYAMGVIADRFNRKTILGVGLLVNALGFMGLAFAPNYATAVAAMVICGVGGSCFHPAATAMVARLFPVGTGRAMGLIGVGASVGFFAGPIYAGWRASQLVATLGDAAWRRPVLELGVLGVLGAILFFVLADDDPPLRVERGAGQPAERMFPTGVLWLLFMAAAFAFCLRDFAGAAMGSLGSLYLQKAHDYSVGAAGWTLSWIFLPSALSNPLLGHLSDRGRKRWAASVLLVAAVLVVVFPHAPVSWAIPLFLVYGFFFMSNYPMVEAELMQSVPDAVRGRVFGLFITVGGLLGNLSHWVVGVAVRRMGEAAHQPASYFGLYGTLAGMIVVSLVGLPCLNAIRKREQGVVAA